MSRYFLEIKYDGTNYHGWQIQQNANSVQAEINKALSTLLQEEIIVTGAGRTDTGVHAKQSYAHFEIDTPLDTQKILFKLNSFLPDDIACVNLTHVAEDAHARFGATERTYEYWINTNKNPFLKNKSYYFPYPLSVELMNEAAEILIQTADYSCFSKSNTDTFTNNCTITYAKWTFKDDLLILTISADRFLRNMVRAIVGTMLEIGQEKIKPSQLLEIIQSKNRSEAGTSVPAHGLYLTSVNYPKEVLHG